MSLSRLLGFFTRSARRAAASVTASDSEAEHFFALRHHSFKLFLTAWNTFQETMTALEYTLCCDHPFGLYRVRALCTSMATLRASIHGPWARNGACAWRATGMGQTGLSSFPARCQKKKSTNA